MDNWKHSFHLALVEFRTQLIYTLFGWFILFIIGGLFLSSFYNYLLNTYVTFDLMFIAYVIFFPYWASSRHAAPKRVNEHLWASPFFLLLTQLPINREIIVRSRLIAYLLRTLPPVFGTFIVLYTFDLRLHQFFTFSTFLIFLIAWVSLNILLGMAIVAMEFGGKVNIFNITFGLGLISALFIWHHYAPIGIVAWTVQIVNMYPLLTFATALFTIFIGWHIWQFIISRNMRKTDYF